MPYIGNGKIAGVTRIEGAPTGGIAVDLLHRGIGKIVASTLSDPLGDFLFRGIDPGAVFDVIARPPGKNAVISDSRTPVIDPTWVYPPLAIPGCVLCLDAADPTTLTLVDDKVTHWYDKSPTEAVFAQTNAALRPTLNTAIFPDGSVDFGISRNSYLTSPTDIDFPAYGTIFAVARRNNSPENYAATCFLQKGTSTGGIQSGLAYPYVMIYTASGPSGSGTQANFNNSVYMYQNGGGPYTNDSFLLTFKYGGTIGDGVIRLNGVGQSLNRAGSTMSTGQTVNTIGSSDALYRANASVSEVLMYDRNLDIDEILEVESFLRDKWGL